MVGARWVAGVAAVAAAVALAGCGGGGAGDVAAQLVVTGSCAAFPNAPGDAPAGSTASCAFTVANPGPGPSQASTLTLSAQAPLVLAGVVCSDFGAGLCPAQASATTRLPPLPEAASLYIELLMQVPEGSNGSPQALARLAEDGRSDNGHGQAAVTLNVFSTDLAASLGVAGQATAGGEVVFIATLANRGAGRYALPGQPVTMTLPAGLSTQTGVLTACVTASGAACPNFDPKRGWGLIVEPLDTQTYTYRVALPADLRGALTAVFSAPVAGDPVPQNNSAQATTLVVAAP